MHVIEVDNVNQALHDGLIYLIDNGVREHSRNGAVLVAPGPVCTVYTKPRERVLFSPLRDANPFFHLMEALWMMAGRNDLLFPQHFNSRFGDYSDDGLTMRGAYGHRWRKWFGYDQLKVIADELRNDPTSRRAVLTMWDASIAQNCDGVWDGDLMATTVDKPCNTHIYFDCRGSRLNMTVCCRSNDILWGAYGANAVHMSVLLEVMAAWVDVPVGVYRQISNNFHLYMDRQTALQARSMANESEGCNYYRYYRNVLPYFIVHTTVERWMEELDLFMEHPNTTFHYSNPFFTEVAVPMFVTWATRKAKLGSGAREAEHIAGDWGTACRQWIDRREAKKEEL